MDKNVKVSIIIPVYNVENYLSECLDSILSQSLNDLEIICINDGSTDGSRHILEEYAKRDDRVRIIEQENAGAGAARNRGVALAHGVYIGFVDSDDILYSTMYEELYEKAVATQAEMVITGEIETFVGDNFKFPDAASGVTADELLLGTFRAIEYPFILKNVFLWNRLYSLDFWKRHNLKVPEQRKFAEDLLICTQTSVLAQRIAYIEGPLYRYRNARENSLSDTLAKSMKKLDYIVAVDESKRFLKNTDAYFFYAPNFLEFAVHLFILQQKRISDRACHQEFFCKMAALLDDEDFTYLKQSWLQDAYPRVLSALQAKRCGAIYFRNRVSALFCIT